MVTWMEVMAKEKNLFEALLVKLDFNGYWSRADDRYNRI